MYLLKIIYYSSIIVISFTFKLITTIELHLSAINLITTAAGTGVTKYNGDEGPATVAQISNSYGIAVDALGNIYIADTYDHRIRMVANSTGIITTVAGTGTYGTSGDGGKATAAQLSNPFGIAVDVSGNIYIADTYDHRIRMVNKSTGIITTVAGSGELEKGYSGDGRLATSAQLSDPYDIAVDVSGNIFIADSSNNCIRMVTKSTGIISTVAGTGVSGNDGDGRQATAAQLSNPSGVAVDTLGNIYIADSYDHRIRVVTKSTGIITTVPGSGYHGYAMRGFEAKSISAQFNGLHGVAVDTLGNIYIADTYDHRIRMVTKSSESIRTVAGTGVSGYSGDGGQATLAEFYGPHGVAVDVLGNIYIADTYDNRIRMVTKSTGIITTVAGTGVDVYSGDRGQATSAQLSNPFGIAVDVSGNIYIADSYDHRIRMVTAGTDIITTVAGTGVSGYSGNGGQATSSQLSNSSDVAVDALGNIYIADTANHCIRLMKKNSGVITTVVGTGVSGYSGDGGQATSAKLSNPYSAVVDTLGNIYIADSSNHCIRMVTKSTGVITTAAGTGVSGYSGDGGQATSAQLSNPYSVAVDVSGNIFIADSSNNCIRMVTKNSGVISAAAGTGVSGYSGDGGQATSAQLTKPYSIAVDILGNIYIADSYDNRIRMVTKSTGIITTLAGTGVSGYSGDGGQALEARFNHPRGIAVSAYGQIYIADSANNCVRIISQHEMSSSWIVSVLQTTQVLVHHVTLSDSHFLSHCAVTPATELSTAPRPV
jgi:trimeric autotransporter adhesin